MKLARIAVGIDFSDAALDAARWVDQHFAGGAQLLLVHALPAPTLPRFLQRLFQGAKAAAADTERARAEADKRLDALATSLGGATVAETRIGAPDVVIPAAAAAFGADIVAIGAHGHRIGSRLGTTADRLIRACRIPVLIARDLPPGPPTRILAPVDDSEMTGDVLGWAALLGRRFGAPVTALHALSADALAAFTVAGSGLGESLSAEAREAAREWLAEGMRVAGLDREGDSAEALFGDPAHEIVSRTERDGYDLVVMGSRGAGAASRALLGSVASLVVRNAYCPVLVV